MAHYCTKCGTQTMIMSGMIYLEIDDEPYEMGKEEKSRIGIKDIERFIIARFCEECNEVIDTFNE